MKKLLPYLFAVTSLAACNTKPLPQHVAEGANRSHWLDVVRNAECDDETNFKFRLTEAMDNGVLVVVSSEDKNYAPMMAHDQTLEMTVTDGQTHADMTYTYRYAQYGDMHAKQTGEKASITRISTIHLRENGRMGEMTLVEEEKTIQATDNTSKTTTSCRLY